MLEHFFGSKTRLKLLKVFFRNPDRSFYVRELTRLIETQLHAVRREIANLELIGIIHQIEQANRELGTERSKFYKLHTEAMLYPELKALLMKSEMMIEQQLVSDLKDKAGAIKFFILTGHFMQDADVETDLLLVGEIKPLVIAKRIKQFEDDLGKTLRYTVMSEEEFRDRRQIGDRFLYSLLDAKHLTMVDEFGIS